MNSKLKNVVMVVVAIILIALVVVFIAKNEKEEPEPVEPTATPVLTPAPTTVPEDQSAFEVDVWAQYTEEEKEQFLSQVQWSPEFEEYIIKRDPEGHSDDPYYYQKMWLMYNPDYTVEGFENPYANEDASRPMGSLVEPGEYVNLEVPYEYAEGKTVYIGTNEAAETDGILLNFYCTEASPSMPIGVYVSSENGCLSTSYEEKDLHDAAYWSNLGMYTCIIPDRTYDRVATAMDYTMWPGVLWQDFLTESTRTESDIVHARLVNLTNGRLIACLEITVEYKDESYQITNIQSADVSVTGRLTEEERTAIVDDAVDFLVDVTRGPAVSIDNADEVKAGAVVEHTKGPYFNSLYDPDQMPASRSSFAKVDTYAVNLNLNGFGVVTVYYGPHTQLAYGFDSETGPGSEDKRLEAYGYDALAPYTLDDIVCVNGFEP